MRPLSHSILHCSDDVTALLLSYFVATHTSYTSRAGEDDFDWDDSDQDDQDGNDEARANRKKLKLLKKKERKAALKARARKEAEDALAKANARYVHTAYTYRVLLLARYCTLSKCPCTAQLQW
jgi:hypothetical protein